MGSVLRSSTATTMARADDVQRLREDGQSARLSVRRRHALRARTRRSSPRYHDDDGDGIAERVATLVRGLGFDLEFRGADHTTNGVEPGHRRLALRRGRRLRLHQGRRHRRREHPASRRRIVPRPARRHRARRVLRAARATSTTWRSIRCMNVFTRDNTNDGGGWDIRLNHFVDRRSSYGYPSLFRNFADEVVPPLADYGGGSGHRLLYVQEPGLPALRRRALLGRLGHEQRLSPSAARRAARRSRPARSCSSACRAPDRLAIDGASRLYAASWRGGQFRYAGEPIGYVAPPDGYRRRQAAVVPDLHACQRCASCRARRVDQPGPPALRSAGAAAPRPHGRTRRPARETGARIGSLPARVRPSSR